MRVAQLAPFAAACNPLCQRRHAPRLQPAAPCLQPAAPRLQVANLVFFVADGALQFWTGVSLTIPALLVGCCAGTLYVQTFTAIDRELEPCKRELALSTASAGTPAGILLADLTGLVVQWCLFKANGIPLANGDGAMGNVTASRCPF